MRWALSSSQHLDANFEPATLKRVQQLVNESITDLNNFLNVEINEDVLGEEFDFNLQTEFVHW